MLLLLALFSISSISFFSCNQIDPNAPKEYFVAKNGSDANPGTAKKPLLTITQAAQLAMPGDTVTVKEGIYREWVNPPRGGSSEDSLITYRAARGEDVRILGSEKATGWQQQNNGIWKLSLPQAFFGNLNPFNTLSRHPLPVGIDESGDGWGWLKYGRWTHLGDVIINGEGLTEKDTITALESTELSWYTETENDTSSIWANFADKNPNKSNVEITTRPHAFYPEKNDVSYITFQGFTVLNVACHWAPPTVYQPAAIGSNGGHHWTIEDNIVMYAKGLAISIGIPNGEANLEESGHHIIKNNVLMRCGQGGTAGQLWNHHSQIYGNHIEDINYREEFGGWETAGIKHHNANEMVIKDNFIRGVYSFDITQGAAHGIWNDFKNENWRISNNIILKTEAHPILMEANFKGPNLLENNILIGGTIGSYSTIGDAWVHNLFVDTKHKWENQVWGDRPRVADARWMNNLFIGGGFDPEIDEDDAIYKSNVYMDEATQYPEDKNATTISTPSEFEVIETDDGLTLSFTLDEQFLATKLPVVSKEDLQLPFTIDASVKSDFFGNARNENNYAGPFTSLKAGKNEVLIYEYTPLYKKALSLIGEE